MPITEFTIGTSRTINLGNFESLRVEASVSWNVEEVDGAGIVSSFHAQTEAAQAELRKLLEQTYMAQHAERKKVAK